MNIRITLFSCFIFKALALKSISPLVVAKEIVDKINHLRGTFVGATMTQQNLAKILNEAEEFAVEQNQFINGVVENLDTILTSQKELDRIVANILSMTMQLNDKIESMINIREQLSLDFDIMVQSYNQMVENLKAVVESVDKEKVKMMPQTIIPINTLDNLGYNWEEPAKIEVELLSEAKEEIKVGNWLSAKNVLLKLWEEFNHTESASLNAHTVDETTLMWHLEYVYEQLNEFDEAKRICSLALSAKRLTIRDRHEFTRKMEQLEQKSITEKLTQLSTDSLKVANESEKDKHKRAQLLSLDMDNYRLCSSCGQEHLFKNAHLFCRLRNDNPLTILTPVKEEILSIDPAVHFYHNILLNSDIEFIENFTKNKFSAAKVLDSKGERFKNEVCYLVK